MKKRRLVGLSMILTFCALIIGGYYWGTNLASDKIAEMVTGELEESGKLEEMKDMIADDPEVKKFLDQAEPDAGSGNSNEAAAADPADTVPTDTAEIENTPQQNNDPAVNEALPFTTKEEAARVLIKKVGLPRIQEMHTEVVEGTADREQIMEEIQSKLSEEEIQALKVVAYEELSKKQEGGE